MKINWERVSTKPGLMGITPESLEAVYNLSDEDITRYEEQEVDRLNKGQPVSLRGSLRTCKNLIEKTLLLRQPNAPYADCRFINGAYYAVTSHYDYAGFLKTGNAQ